MKRTLWIVLTCLGSLASLTAAANLSAGEPTAQEQLWLQWINRFRANPAGELDRMVRYTQPVNGKAFASPPADDPTVAGALSYFDVNPAILRNQFDSLSPAPPLAWSPALHDSARYYSQLVIARDQQSHTLDGLDLLQRVQRHGGFDLAGGGAVGENVFAFANSPWHAHAGFLIDWGRTASGIQNPPGHRDSLINPMFREIGVSFLADTDPRTRVGPYVATQHLAVDLADGPYLTGAVYRDLNQNQFYTPGEGLEEMVVELLPLDSLQSLARTRTFSSGGYTLDLGDVDPGTYRVRLRSPGLSEIVSGVEVHGTMNLGLDFPDPAPQIDALSAAVLDGPYRSYFDLDLDGRLTREDRRIWVEELKRTFYGDADLDGQFDSGDLIRVFQAGEYEDLPSENSRWGTGDWDGDREFSSSDLIVAFQQGAYERGPRVALVALPEPATSGWLLILGVWLARHRRPSR